MTITILDGGMGQELLARSTARATGLWSAQILLDDPDLVRTVHADYLAAGADVITTNSYVLHRDRLAPFGVEDRFEQLHRWPAGWPWKRGMPMGPVLWPDRWVPTHAPTGRTWR
jgi:S-methylmethionine-dependent homocysteine/selenocysteine methylase